MITVENLNRSFPSGDGEFHALKNVSLLVDDGECVVLKGVSGSGKTTLLSIIAGLDRPTSGKVLVEGEAIAKLPDLHLSQFRARRIGMIFQHYNLMEHLTVAENVMVPLIPTGLDADEIVQRVDAALKHANIAHKRTTPAARLSGGEKQRTSIARSLVADPAIILCDEPTANLDRANSLRFIEILGQLHEGGKTIVIATHDPLFDDLPFAARVVAMEDGQIAIGDLAERVEDSE
jgi:putative ABC transport system ATP-binding protein